MKAADRDKKIAMRKAGLQFTKSAMRTPPTKKNIAVKVAVPQPRRKST